MCCVYEYEFQVTRRETINNTLFADRPAADEQDLCAECNDENKFNFNELRFIVKYRVNLRGASKMFDNKFVT